MRELVKETPYPSQPTVPETDWPSGVTFPSIHARPHGPKAGTVAVPDEEKRAVEIDRAAPANVPHVPQYPESDMSSPFWTTSIRKHSRCRSRPCQVPVR